jgi:hypothetical protein
MIMRSQAKVAKAKLAKAKVVSARTIFVVVLSLRRVVARALSAKRQHDQMEI